MRKDARAAGAVGPALSVLAACLIFAAVARPAGALSVLGRESELTNEKMERQAGTVTFTRFRGKLYRRIRASDLQGLAVDGTPLDNLLVCVEGRFDRVTTGGFRVTGSQGEFVVREAGALVTFTGGDNLWVGGMAQRVPQKQQCYVAVHGIVKLGGDFELFEERSKAFVADKDWEALIELGRWIEQVGMEVHGGVLDRTNRYNVAKEEAYREAIRIRSTPVAATDADGQYEIAALTVKLLGQKVGRLSALDHLLLAVKTDPEHGKATLLLKDLGYVQYSGRWMLVDERDRLLRAQEEEAARLRAEREAEILAKDQPRQSLGPRERIRRMLELEWSARSGPASLKDVASRLAGEDDAIARRLIWVLANCGVTTLVRPEDIRGASADVRRDFAMAKAWAGELHDVAEMIRTDLNPRVREHAVKVLAAAGAGEDADERRSREVVGLLVDLTGQVEGPVSPLLDNVLGDLTGWRLSGHEAWAKWWAESGADYHGPRRRGPGQ